MKYYIIAGERSGDLHASNLIKSLAKLDSDMEAKGFGGDYMSEAGVDISVHYKNLAFMGFFEVVKNLNTIKKYLNRCKKEIVEFSPDAVILVDYAGFNLKIAKYVKSLGIPVYYYISPKVWAWNQKRAYKIKDRVDKLMAIMPFEPVFYEKYDWEVAYVGNPVLDAIKDYSPDSSKLANLNEYVAVLPGSRAQELTTVMPVIKQLAKQMPHQAFAVAAVDNLPSELYLGVDKLPNVQLFYGYTYDLLSEAKAAVVTSGTATLETAVWGVPQVVIYKTSYVSYEIAKRLIKVPFISLVNLIAEKEVVKELIQKDMNSNEVEGELSKLLFDKDYISQMKQEYATLRKKLDVGRASDNAANIIIEELKTKKAG